MPEVAQIAHISLNSCGVSNDTIIDDRSAPYPHDNDFEVEALTTDGYADLLRIERGRLQNREIFGPYRLHYGFFKLRSKNSYYLIAKRQGRRVGALGFTVDPIDKIVRIFELIHSNESVIRFLFEQALKQAKAKHDSQFIEVDVNAHAPRMQRTLLELGFLPIAYIPAFVFQDVERLDIVKLAKIFTPMQAETNKLIPAMQTMSSAVRRLHAARTIQPRILSALHKINLFKRLTEEQQLRLASYFSVKNYAKGEELFSEGKQPERIFVVLKGNVSISMANHDQKIGSIKEGECVGEISSLTGKLHSATAKAENEAETATINLADLRELIRLRPDIGVLVFENFARELGHKLRRTDIERFRST